VGIRRWSMLGASEQTDYDALIFMQRYLLYIHERFSPAQLVPLAIFFGVAIGILAPRLADTNNEYIRIILVSVALFLFLFRLRLLDDIKDHAHDSVHHRERPGARGIVSQYELASTAVAVFVFESAIAYDCGATAVVAFVVMNIYAGALFLEALYRDRMRELFTLYIIVHEFLLVPLLVYLSLLAGTPLVNMATMPLVWLIIFLSAHFFLIEVGRKLRAPQHEGTGRDTYTAQYGVRGATIILTATAVVAYTAVVAISFRILDAPLATSALGLFALLSFCYYAYNFMQHPTPSSAHRLFTVVGTYVAFSLLLLPCALWL
jgi:hypothetical protein